MNFTTDHSIKLKQMTAPVQLIVPNFVDKAKLSFLYELLSEPLESERFLRENQFSFTSSTGTDIFGGIGSLYSRETLQFTAATQDFAKFNNVFKETFMESIYTKVCEIAREYGVDVGRVRFMRLKSKTCYSLHFDPEEFRFHIPLKTSLSSFFVVDNQCLRMPDLGSLYILKTNKYHTAINASLEDRDHIVFDTYVPNELLNSTQS